MLNTKDIFLFEPESVKKTIKSKEKRQIPSTADTDSRNLRESRIKGACDLHSKQSTYIE
jgi:hypothetical protein